MLSGSSTQTSNRVAPTELKQANRDFGVAANPATFQQSALVWQ